MSPRQKVLVVSGVDIIDIVSSLNELAISIAANYEEAIEQLENAEFDHVITDAVLPRQKSGLDILRFTRDYFPDTKVVVCHTTESCVISGNRTWFIARCLTVHFPAAEFKKQSIPRHLSELLPRRKSA